jgi:large conductance mechanosensitive channel
MPPLAIILPINKNIEEKFAILRPGESYNATAGYNTLQQALDDGAVVMAYGYGIKNLARFLPR